MWKYSYQKKWYCYNQKRWFVSEIYLCRMLVLCLCRDKKNSESTEISLKCNYSEHTVLLHNIQCSTDPFDDIVPNGFLGLLMPFAESIGFFQFFNDFLHVKMKEVDYTNIDRIKTLIASIAIGCQHNKDINHKLVPYKGSAECCGLAQFPDQSQINRFIKRFDIYNISELDFIFEHLLSCYGLWRSQQKVDIDFDCSGITVYGKRYELARKGYFPKKRSSRGYQLSLTTTANTPFKEILSLHLDQGNACADNHFWDGIYQATEILKH
jgi:hypothetical protein